MSEIIEQILGDVRLRLRELYCDRLVRVVLYGSHARGEATADSDVDVIVVLKGEVDAFDEIWRTSVISAEMMEKYGELVSIQPLSESRYGDRLHPLMMNVHREGVDL